jgi:CRISPR-associated protein Csd1
MEFLQALEQYATQIGVPPPMYRTVAVRYIIHLTAQGVAVGITDTRSSEAGRSTSLPVAAQSLRAAAATMTTTAEQEQPRGGRRSSRQARPAPLVSAEFAAPDLRRSTRIVAKPLSDRADYTLGRVRPGDDPEKAARRHWAYIKAVQAAAGATGEPSVQAVLQFLTKRAPQDLLDLPEGFGKAAETLPEVGSAFHGELDLPEDFDDDARITFSVDGVMPIDIPAVQQHWAEVASVGDDELRMQCLVCLRERPPVRRLSIPIFGLPGGQSSGMSLISMNARAFESYGLEASLNSPICEECQHRVGTALNALLRDPDTHWRTADGVFIFWARDRRPLPLGKLLRESDPAQVRRMLTAPWTGPQDGTVDLDSALFYVALLKANATRVALLDWREERLADLLANLRRYFALQRIEAYDPEKQVVGARTFPLWELGGATIRLAGGNKEREKVAPEVEEALLRLALEGTPLPYAPLTRVLARIEAEAGAVRPAQAALLKMFLLSQEDVSWVRAPGRLRRAMRPVSKEGESMTTQTTTAAAASWEAVVLEGLDEECDDIAYLLGRLFVELEDLQYAAVGDVNKGIRDRFLTQTALYPAINFGELLKGKEAHLMAVRRRNSARYLFFEKRLDALLARIPDFPEEFSPEQAARFMLATHHQRGHNIAERMEAARRRKAASSEESPEQVVLSEAEEMQAALPVGVGQENAVQEDAQS